MMTSSANDKKDNKMLNNTFQEDRQQALHKARMKLSDKITMNRILIIGLRLHDFGMF